MRKLSCNRFSQNRLRSIITGWRSSGVLDLRIVMIEYFFNDNLQVFCVLVFYILQFGIYTLLIVIWGNPFHHYLFQILLAYFVPSRNFAHDPFSGFCFIIRCQPSKRFVLYPGKGHKSQILHLVHFLGNTFSDIVKRHINNFTLIYKSKLLLSTGKVQSIVRIC